MPPVNSQDRKKDITPAALRIGMIGCGRVTETCHLPALAGLRDRAIVVAVADPDEHRCRRISGMFDVPHRFNSVEAMLRGANPIDAVAICMPADRHAQGVVAALEAGKHVLVEKPIALTLDDADRIATASAAHPELKVMLGFNLRQHRLVRQAKEMIAQGALGELQMIRTLWTSNSRGHMKLPPWRLRRKTGGGVLSEVAVHHFDLIRHLTGASIDNVFARCTHGQSDDETAGVVMQLSSGATAMSSFSEVSGDANEIELIGSKGRIAFSIYRFDSFTFTPTGSLGDRVGNLKRNLRQFPHAWSILRRGGDFHETYRQEWLAFFQAIQSENNPTATVEDGVQALRSVLAAQASANRASPVAIVDSPRQPEPVSISGRAEIIAEPIVDSSSNAPKLSAILATQGSFQAIAQTVGYLRAQTVQNQIELVIVCPDKNRVSLDESEMKGFWGHQVVEASPRFDSVAPAYAAGIRAAKAPIIALCEDHAFPAPDWAESLLIAHRGPYAAVGPVLHNANPSTLVSRVDMVMAYGDWLEPIKPAEPAHLPGHNSSYKRDILLSYGDRLAALLDAETVLFWELRDKGHRLYLDPMARLAHTNFAHFKVWSLVQFHGGRVFAATRALNWPIWKRAIYTCASPLIPLVRLKRIWNNSRRLDPSHRLRPAFLLVLLVGLSLDGLGQMVGYAFGVGKSNQISYEFCRIDHVTDDDRRRLEAGNPALSRVNQ